MSSKMSTRLASLRQRMQLRNVQAYLVPSCDAHQSEYIAASDARRSFISGFTGSAGYAVVTTDKAALWTDGRYFLQAGQQLDSKHWLLMKQGMPETPEKEEWLNNVLPPSSNIGFDPKLVTIEQLEQMRKLLEKQKHALVAIQEENLIDSVWDKEQPAIPAEPVRALSMRYAGKSHVDKISDLQKYLQEFPGKDSSKHLPKDVKPLGFIVTALDEVAWLMNLRGSDIVYNPVFFAYAVVTTERCWLYVDDSKLDEGARTHLQQGKVEIRPYRSIFADLKSFGGKYELDNEVDEKAASGMTEKKIRKFLVSSSCNVAIQEALGKREWLEVVRSPVQQAKAIKNEVELEGFRQCHIRDATALVNFFAWLENTLVVEGKKDLSEVQAADVLEKFRSEQQDFVGLSFDTISSVGANAAIIHYKPEEETAAKLDVNQIYLCDSGAQYRDGTTDVTRTLHFGTPTEFEREAFTRVLQGHIALDMAIFPTGTTGYVLDVLARTPLWEAGLNYRHGTGHGVGHFLNVHEGPHGIGVRIAYNDVPLESGMTVTNEPGYYHDHHFGIRIENVLLIKEVATANCFGDKPYLGFEHVTVAPIGKNLMNVNMLSAKEKEWVNRYHEKCWSLLKDRVGELGREWLHRETRKI